MKVFTIIFCMLLGFYSNAQVFGLSTDCTIKVEYDTGIAPSDVLSAGDTVNLHWTSISSACEDIFTVIGDSVFVVKESGIYYFNGLHSGIDRGGNDLYYSETYQNGKTRLSPGVYIGYLSTVDTTTWNSTTTPEIALSMNTNDSLIWRFVASQNCAGDCFGKPLGGVKEIYSIYEIKRLD